MPTAVLLAVIFINLALIFYSIGVWWERLAGELQSKHLLFFWAGFASDSIGTEMMRRILGGHIVLNLHGVTGLSALTLMLVHALWASWTLIKGSAAAKRSFHRFSIVVWFIWLIPYLSGYLLSMSGPR